MGVTAHGIRYATSPPITVIGTPVQRLSGFWQLYACSMSQRKGCDAMKALNLSGKADSMESELDVSPSVAPCKTAQTVWPRPLTGFFPLLPALLSSSCCLLQLALNVFSLGCAGFAWLTPYRCVPVDRCRRIPPPSTDFCTAAAVHAAHVASSRLAMFCTSACLMSHAVAVASPRARQLRTHQCQVLP